MLRGIYQNSSSMLLLESKIDNIANNIANVNTTGYKKRGVFFEQLIAAEQAVEKNQIDVILPKGKIATYINSEPGKLEKTGNPFNVAISGEGYFTLQTPQGQAFTRSGEFTINQDGMLVNSKGYQVVGEGGPIEINGDHVEIDKEGNISVDGLVLNKFLIQTFDLNSSSLEEENLFLNPNNIRSVESGKLSIMQGFVEHSNVNVVKEMVDMIAAHKHYGINERVVRAFDTTLNKTVNMVGK